MLVTKQLSVTCVGHHCTEACPCSCRRPFSIAHFRYWMGGCMNRPASVQSFSQSLKAISSTEYFVVKKEQLSILRVGPSLSHLGDFMFSVRVSRSNFEIALAQELLVWLMWSEILRYWDDCMTYSFDHTHDLDPRVLRSENSLISTYQGWPVDLERKGWESYIHEHNSGFCVTMVWWVEVPDSDQGTSDVGVPLKYVDFPCQQSWWASNGKCVGCDSWYGWYFGQMGRHIFLVCYFVCHMSRLTIMLSLS